MANKVKVREVRVQVAPGVTLVAEIDDISGLKSLLSELKEHGFKPTAEISAQEPKKPDRKDTKPGDGSGDSSAQMVEVRSGISPGSLRKSNVLGFKDDVPQLLRPGAFSSVSDATLTLIYSIEVGLKSSSISFDNFKALFDDQNIKSGSPLSMLLNNLKNSGYIDKRMYGADRTIRLTAKGEKKAIEVLKELAGAN